MNRFMFMGRLTADPEIRRTQDGKPVIRYRFAVNRTFKRDGDPDADFFQIVMFGSPAERFEKLNIRKGIKLLIEGEVRNNNFTDKDGVKHYEVQFVANNFEFCEAKRAENGNATAPAMNYQTAMAKAEEPGFMPLDDAVDDFPWS